MNKILKVMEVESMVVEDLEKMMSDKEAERMHKLGFAEYSTFLDKLQDDVVLSGLEDDDDFMSISDYLGKLKEEQAKYEPEVEYVDTDSVKENGLMVSDADNGAIMGFDELRNTSETKVKTYTNIENRKLLFNLETKVDKLLNDCENQIIKVKGVVINIYDKILKKPIIKEETGEILKDAGERAVTMNCILVDANGTSYATGSKIFTLQLMRFIEKYGLKEFSDGLEIKIIKQKMEKGEGKALRFELVL